MIPARFHGPGLARSWRSLSLVCLVLALRTIEPANVANAADAAPPSPSQLPVGGLDRGSEQAKDTYTTLGHLAVMHDGRVKPLDTVCRQVFKQVYGRETFKRTNSRGEVIETWGPVAAVVGWSIHPTAWNQRPFLLAEYLPLKRLIFHQPIVERLEKIANQAGASADVREKAKALAARSDWTADELLRLASVSGLSAEDQTDLEALAEKLRESSKWVSPEDLETAEVPFNGKNVPFQEWVVALEEKSQPQGPMSESPRLPEVEKKALEVAQRWLTYKLIRDRDHRARQLAILAVPRPSSAEALKYLADSIDAAVAAQRSSGRAGLMQMPPLQFDSAKLLDKFSNELPESDRKTPGTDEKFDGRIKGWLQSKAEWLSLAILLSSPIEELTKAGYPKDKLEAFRGAYAAFEEAERASPGNAPDSKAEAVVATARELGASVGGYPSEAEMEREVHFNAFAPFFHAPSAYGSAMLLFLLALVANGLSTRSTSPVGRLGSTLYLVGLLSFVIGIGLEVYGFYLRVRISGWAPVSNMYETVIWVALVTSVIGLILELASRKIYPGLAASGVALMATLLAANVSLLDPNIKALQPVLRSNYWLVIHVLTIVSSYAAFALSMGLGLIGTMYYLTATYRRDVGYGELSRPLRWSLPVMAVGVYALTCSYTATGPAFFSSTGGFYIAAGLAYLGGIPTIMGLTSLVGEAVSRWMLPQRTAMAIASSAASASEEVSQAVTGPLSVQEILAKVSQSAGPKLSAREQAMLATAARIKPISNFVYRAMQVGVLLIAAGTILGGVWADYSWGRFWGWDPKEVWALISLLVYLIPLHGRFAGWVNTFGLIAASVVCFSSVLMAWYGVNFVLGVGLHSYGFVEGGSQGAVSACAIAIMAVVAGAAWRRSLAYRPSPTATTA